MFPYQWAGTDRRDNTELLGFGDRIGEDSNPS